MELAHVSPSGLRGGDHAFAVTRPDSDLKWLARSFVEASERRVVEILNDQPGIELRIEDEPLQEVA